MSSMQSYFPGDGKSQIIRRTLLIKFLKRLLCLEVNPRALLIQHFPF